jgi:hypothetical protein
MRTAVNTGLPFGRIARLAGTVPAGAGGGSSATEELPQHCGGLPFSVALVRKAARGAAKVIGRDRGDRAAFLRRQSCACADRNRIGEEGLAEGALRIEARQEMLELILHQSMIPKSVQRFSEKIMLHQ